jgi:hypothetical protein
MARMIPDAIEYRGCNDRVRLTLISQENLPAAVAKMIGSAVVIELTIPLRIFWR